MSWTMFRVPWFTSIQPRSRMSLKPWTQIARHQHVDKRLFGRNSVWRKTRSRGVRNIGTGAAGAFVTWPKMLSVIIPPISASIEKTMNIRNSLRGGAGKNEEYTVHCSSYFMLNVEIVSHYVLQNTNLTLYYS